ELVGAVTVVFACVLRMAPSLEFLFNFIWHPGVIGDEIQQPFLVIFVFFNNLPSTLIACLWIVIIHPDVVAAEGAVVVCICFTVWDDIKFIKPLPPSRIKNPNQQFVLGGIIIFGSGEGYTIIRMIRHTGSKAISLHFMVSFPLYPWVVGAYARQ